MRNQTSFRLTTTLLPSDMSAKTTQVINKVDSTGARFYPTFTEETIVITNDDRTVMETTRATCNEGVLTFTVRGLPDNGSLTPVDNRKLTWNPGSLCFITAGASDWIDKDDDITWSGNQTYEGDMTAKGKATYKGRLITEKGVEYPHFDNVAALEAYASPFGGMFAVVDSSGELYRYNAVTEEWSVVTTATPSNPEMASTTTIGTVRGATDTEFANGTATGSQGELLVATPAQIQTVTPQQAAQDQIGTVRIATQSEFRNGVNQGSNSEFLLPRITHLKKGILGLTESLGNISLSITDKGQDLSTIFYADFDGLICLDRHEFIINGVIVTKASINAAAYTYNYVSELRGGYAVQGGVCINHRDLYYVTKGNTYTLSYHSSSSNDYSFSEVSSTKRKAQVTSNGIVFKFNV